MPPLVRAAWIATRTGSDAVWASRVRAQAPPAPVSTSNAAVANPILTVRTVMCLCNTTRRVGVRDRAGSARRDHEDPLPSHVAAEIARTGRWRSVDVDMTAPDRPAGVLRDEPPAADPPVGRDVYAAAEGDQARVDRDAAVVAKRQRRAGGERDAAVAERSHAASVRPAAGRQREG